MMHGETKQSLHLFEGAALFQLRYRPIRKLQASGSQVEPVENLAIFLGGLGFRV